MADELDTPPPAPEPTPAPEAPAPDPALELAQARADLERERARASAYETAMQAIQRPGPVQQAPGIGPLNAQAVEYLRRQGFNDEAIQQNLQIILPFLEVVGAPIIQTIQQQNAQLEYLKAARNKKSYKHWDALEDQIEAVRIEAERAGRYLSPKEAYAIAYANAPEQVRQQQAVQQQATAHATDVAAQANRVSPQTRLNTDLPKRPTSGAELAALSPEERSKLWDDLADTPIQ